MTEIEKMFENVGVELVADAKFPTKDVNYNVGYPPFTAEKQLELIKWLAKIYELSINWEKQYNSYRFEIRDYRNGRLNHSVCCYEEPFEETLAYLINRIWKDLTDQEKEEIRRILNEK